MAKSWWISTPKRSSWPQNSKENKSMISKIIGFLFLVALVIAVIYFIPIVFIWCINTLFQTAIANTWTNWFAALVLLMLIGNGSGLSYKKTKKQSGGCCKNH